MFTRPGAQKVTPPPPHFVCLIEIIVSQLSNEIGLRVSLVQGDRLYCAGGEVY